MTVPRLLWDTGTAYDLFISLEVLHRPQDYGVRGSWAAGVRARLAVEERETLAQAQAVLWCTPLHWAHALPSPKDSATALWVLGRTPPAERLAELGLPPTLPPEVRDTLHEIGTRQAWRKTDEQVLQAHVQAEHKQQAFPPKRLIEILAGWANPAEFGARFLQALKSYHEVFFAEEERRIRPALASAVSRAQALAEELPLPELVEHLTQGVRFSDLPDVDEVVLAPSFWSTPLIFYGEASPERAIWLFGAKPDDASLVPGDAVPDALLRTFKALSDPTRLRILRYLAEEPLTAAELSRRLRLRIPTVTHHLNTLRLAGLVQLTVTQIEGKEKDLYAVRYEAAEVAFGGLRRFLGQGST